MKYPMKLSTYMLAVAWLTSGAVAILRKDYLFTLLAVASFGYAIQILIYLRDQDYAQRPQTQMRADKKDQHP